MTETVEPTKRRKRRQRRQRRHLHLTQEGIDNFKRWTNELISNPSLVQRSKRQSLLTPVHEAVLTLRKLGASYRTIAETLKEKAGISMRAGSVAFYIRRHSKTDE